MQCSPAMAQQGVWKSGNTKTNKAAKKAGDTKNKVKTYGDHIRNWGMDTGLIHAFLIGGKLNSDGWSGNAYLVKKKSYPWSRIWQLSFSEIKHEKQVKLKGKGNAEFGNPLPYVYGKVNNLYTLQIGYGHEKMLLPGVMEGNISVGIRYCFGLSLAILKPYSLQLTYLENINGKDSTHLEEHYYSPADSEKFLNPSAIFGASKWQRGLGEMRYVPGAHFEVAFAILPMKGKTFVQAITLGVNGAFYARKLPIMAEQEAYRGQASLFAGLALGKRR